MQKDCPRRPPAKSACLEGPILEAHIGTLHSPAVSHLLSDTTFPQLGILRVPLFVPVLAGFLLRTTQVRSAPVSNWQPLISPEVPCPRRPPAKLNILSFALASDARDSHTPVSDQGECPPPPPALLTQDSMPRERRHLAGEPGKEVRLCFFLCALGGMFSRRPWPSEVSY